MAENLYDPKIHARPDQLAVRDGRLVATFFARPESGELYEQYDSYADYGPALPAVIDDARRAGIPVNE